MSQSIAPEGKRCKTCQQVKDSSEFYIRRNVCKECNKQRDKYQCKVCRVVLRKADRICPGPRTTYCVKCWETIQGKKKCVGCRVYKDIEEFSEDKSRPDGHEYYCKDCRRG